MAYTREEVLRIVRTFRDAIDGLVHPDRMILFGSYAVGNARDYSDIDVAVVSSEINDKNYFDLKKKIFKKAMELNSQLEPLCFSSEEFENDWLPIVPEIKRSGVEVSGI